VIIALGEEHGLEKSTAVTEGCGRLRRQRAVIVALEHGLP
jgi:hypothetical protein